MPSSSRKHLASLAGVVLLLAMGVPWRFPGVDAAAATPSTPPTSPDRTQIAAASEKGGPASSSSRAAAAASAAGAGAAPRYAPHLQSVGLSSLVDGETGRVFWQGGPGSIRLSSGAVARKAGLRHVRATTLTALLVLAVLSALAARIREVLFGFADSVTAAGGGERLHRTALALAARIAAVLLWLPRFEWWFIVVVGGLYLLEAYCCSTRRYLENALSGPSAVEEYVESLREERPEVAWKVRCFHYETRRVGPSSLGKENGADGTSHGSDESSGSGASVDDSSKSSLRTKKVVTHTASKTYEFASWSDNTVAGVWKRAQSSDVVAPFAKISLSKMLVLSDAKTREDYFRQQSQFVSEEGQRDEYAEFSTSIKVEGFKPKVLAIRPVRVLVTSQPKLFRIHLFWLFTLLGMTVPYRVWFSRHCDELRVTLVKETSTVAAEVSNALVPVPAAGKEERALVAKLLPSWLPFQPQQGAANGGGSAAAAGARERLGGDFRRKMQQISLYQKDRNCTVDADVEGNEGAAIEAAKRRAEAPVELPDDTPKRRQEDGAVNSSDKSAAVRLPSNDSVCPADENSANTTQAKQSMIVPPPARITDNGS